MDVEYTKADRIISLNTPEDIYDIAALLRDQERFVVEKIVSRNNGEQAAVVSTSRLRNIAGKYTGKDDPVALVRTQGSFPGSRFFYLSNIVTQKGKEQKNKKYPGIFYRGIYFNSVLIKNYFIKIIFIV